MSRGRLGNPVHGRHKRETSLSREATMEAMTGIVPTTGKPLSTRDTSVAQQLP